ncbi:metallopeptidase (plasmid) [Paraburkholderia sp. PGU19]|uniref:M24 family metallopeptidase n=1 Tax=Paraburkholderia sp. PGU19 TaxID=2735434 RepID=UPI0015D96A87|nr:Xaa-Pro peptidase family protein [Paraburkholderia sp. PGU19]BCG02436.1 metallopeptidase [Paraburkholderia sp. PGU19]
MAIGVGGSTVEVELDELHDMTSGVGPIKDEEYCDRIARAQKLMRDSGIDAMIVDGNSNMFYFTGISWHRSERLVAAIIPARGEIKYVIPAFEKGTFESMLRVPGAINLWDEHENPYEHLVRIVRGMGIRTGKVGLDETAPFLTFERVRGIADGLEIVSAASVTTLCRMIKSRSEIALLQRANDMTLRVHRAAARILRDGIRVDEVIDFINIAHRKVGAQRGSTFCIVLFGEDTAFPHGVKSPKALERNDMVLIDTGCQLYGYCSDITRTYVFGSATHRQREVWEHEKQAQRSAFNAAQIGAIAGSVDFAVREYIESVGYRENYGLPGVPHRTGHGIGLELHEHPYVVRGNDVLLDAGMCFSIEPMICVPGEFGIRHEDHVYMTEHGPEWFTQPALSIDHPFGE